MDRIRRIVKEEFNAEVLDIRKINKGYSHNMFLVKIKKDNFYLDIVIRFSNNIREDVNLAKEKLVIDMLASKGIPVPEIYAVKDLRSKDGYMIMEKINHLNVDDIWKYLSREEKMQIVVEMGKLLKKIHSIKLEKSGALNDDGSIGKKVSFKFKSDKYRRYSEFLRTRLKYHFEGLAELMSHKLFNAEFLSKYIKYISNNLDLIDYKGRPVLIHGDFFPGHIFVEKEEGKFKIKKIIDFEFANSSSPARDFIKLHRYGIFDDKDLKKSLIEGYGPINEKEVEVHRVSRDLEFMSVLIDAGNTNKSKEVEKFIRSKIETSI